MDQDTLRGVDSEVNLEVLAELPVSSLFHAAANGNINVLKEQKAATLLEVGDNGATLLHHAAANNQPTVVQYLLDCGLNCDAVDNDGNTPLHMATIQGNTEIIHLLLKHGAKDTILNNAMVSPLHFAVCNNDLNLVQALVRNPRVEIVQPGPDKNTPMHIVAMHDHIESFKVLCQSSQMAQTAKRTHGYKVCSKNSMGLTPLHVAARNGSHQVLRSIIEMSHLHGYSYEVDMEILDASDDSPLYSSVEAGHTEVVEILLKYGAIPTKRSGGSKLPPLHFACVHGKLEMLKLMVEHCGRDILRRRDQFGRVPAFYSAISSRSASIIAFLAANGVDLNEQEDNSGVTALHLAITCGNLSSVTELLSRGADPLIKNNEGSNSAHLAVSFRRKKIFEILTLHETFPQLFTDKDNEGLSAIQLALRKGQGDLVLPLFSSNRVQMAHNMYDADNNNCLHLAAASNDWRTLRALLKMTAFANCVNSLNNNGETPLHLAAQGGELRSVELLLSHGAITTQSLSGTAWMHACFNGHSKCALTLYNTHPFQKNWKDKNGNTALHFAALGGDPKTLCTVLDIGCNISENDEGLTFVDIIITTANLSCAFVLVNHSRWQECLDYPSKYNPMIGLIEQLPSVAKRVLDRSHTRASSDKKQLDYWEKFDFKYLQAPQRMLTKTRYPHKSESTELSLPLDQENMNSMTIVRRMVKYKRLDLLIHPVVERYVSDKWRTYGIRLYLVSFTFRLIAAILLSAFILIVPHPDIAAQNSAQESVNVTYNSSGAEMFTLSTPIQFLRVTTLVFNFFLTIFALLPLSSTYKRLLTMENLPILVYIISILCTYTFLLAPNPADVWIVGALASFFAWLAVTMGLLLFNVVGIYVRMFITVTVTVFQVLILSFFLLLAFALPFYVLAGPLPVFSSIGYSLFTLFSYMFGEVQYELFILTDQSGNLNHSPLVFLFVIAVVIIMTIALANLLVGLAVGDIEGIRGSALLERRKLHVIYLSHLERSPLFRRHKKPYIMSYPNRKLSLTKRICKCLMAVVRDDEVPAAMIVANSENVHTVMHEHISGNHEEISEMKQQLEELTLSVKQLSQHVQQGTERRHCPNCT